MIDRDPDLQSGPFRLWLSKSRCAQGDDPYSQALLDFDLVVETHWSSVRASGEISAGDLAAFQIDLIEVHASLAGNALLESTVSATRLSLEISVTHLGHAVFVLAVRPDDEERHRVEWGGDQTDLEPLLHQLKAVLERHPSPYVPAPRAGASSTSVIRRRLGFWSWLSDLVFGAKTSPN